MALFSGEFCFRLDAQMRSEVPSGGLVNVLHGQSYPGASDAHHFDLDGLAPTKQISGRIGTSSLLDVGNVHHTLLTLVSDFTST